MALRYSHTQWRRLGRVDTYRVLGKTKAEILDSRTPRSSSREYGQFIKGKDLKPYSRIKPREEKSLKTNNNYGQLERKEFASSRARYHRTGPAFNRFITSSADYGHF
eukprot:TRINITY_DN10413_c0_g1_i2.p1 TRINITY_DN10413_c0_g1~~TRINITY_DN10413_c0_g1_i2.p1  ORF type:complete len:107 (+),score=15.30 TRINITY_DN10413_c0_g1_i2:59-379(+)